MKHGQIAKLFSFFSVKRYAKNAFIGPSTDSGGPPNLRTLGSKLNVGPVRTLGFCIGLDQPDSVDEEMKTYYKNIVNLSQIFRLIRYETNKIWVTRQEKAMV